MSRFLAALAFFSFVSANVQAACFEDNDTVTLEGVVSTEMVKLDPNDFGWVPADGKVYYTRLTTTEPFCIEVDGGKLQNQTLVQIGMGADGLENAELIKDGARVRVSGDLFGAHTAHHFENLVMVVTKIKK